MKKRHVDCIVPCWQNIYYTKQAVTSFLARTDPKKTPFHLILIDNGSTDGTWEYITEVAKANPNVVGVKNDTNLGWVGACNQGVEKACGKHDYLLFLNNDTMMTQDDWLPKMIGSIDGERRLVGCGPTSNAVAGRQNTIHDKPGCISEDVAYLIGFCMLFKRHAVEHLIEKDGFFMDPIFSPGGCDELDVCYRLFSDGWRFRINRQVYVHHFCSKSLDKITNDLQAYHNEKEALLTKKHGGDKIMKWMGLMDPRVLVAVPTTGMVHWRFCYQFATLEQTPKMGFTMKARSLPDVARNHMAREAIENGYSYILYLDDDMISNNQSIIKKFLKTMEERPEIDMLSALAFMRNPPFYCCSFYCSDDIPYFKPLTEFKKGLVEVDATTSACTMIRTSVFRKLEEKLGHDRYYEWTDVGKEKMGEDLSFCVRLKKLIGGRIFVDTDEQFWHIGDPLLVGQPTFEKYHESKVVQEALKF